MNKHLVISLALMACLHVHVDCAVAQDTPPEGRTGRHIAPQSDEPRPKVTPKRIQEKRTGETSQPKEPVAPQPAQIKPKNPTGLNDDIFVAAENGDLQRVQDLLRLGTDINAVQNRSKNTPVIIAIRHDRVDVANYLLDNGADPKLHDRGGGSCLQWAAHWGRLELALRLLDAGADMNLINNEGRAPIHYAARRGHIDVVKLLIERGANVNTTSGFGNAPIDLALTNPKPDMADLLIAAGAKLADTPQNAIARITVAAQKNWTPIVEEILNQAKRRPQLVQRLLDAAFDSAIGPRHEALLLLVSAHERNISPRTAVGFSRLYQACSIGAEELAREFVRRGADVNDTIQPSGWTPLHGAVLGGGLNIVTMLLQNGANPNAQDGLGRTPLHLVASERRPFLVPALVKGNANLDATDAFGRTPMHYAATLGNRSVVEALLKAGAAPDTADKDGITPYVAAERNAHFDITAILPKPIPVEIPLPPGFEPLVRAAAESQTPTGLERERNRLLPAVQDGVPLIHLAVMEQSLAAVNQILAETPQAATERDAYGYLPLHRAAALPDTSVLDALLSATKVLNDAANPARWTPLHIAASSGNAPAVQALLERRADPRAKDAAGNDPAYVARELGYSELEAQIRRAP